MADWDCELLGWPGADTFFAGLPSLPSAVTALLAGSREREPESDSVAARASPYVASHDAAALD
jgi:hypothetical protein